MTFKIIPDEGWYVSKVIFNGVEMSNLDPSGTTVYTEALPARSTLEVTFTDYLENPDYINAFSTPYMFFLDKDAYYFGKVFAGLIPEEYGILISSNPDPTDGEADTKRLKSDPIRSLDVNGHFGIRLVNNTGNENLKIYLRPYVIYNGILRAGDCHYVDFETVKETDDTVILNSWLEDAGLNDSGIMEFTLTE